MVAVDDATDIYSSLLARALELVGNSADAEDLVQTAYLRMCETPPTTQDPVEFKHWMRTVIRNAWIDGRRRRALAEPINPRDACQCCGSYDARCACC